MLMYSNSQNYFKVIVIIILIYGMLENKFCEELFLYFNFAETIQKFRLLKKSAQVVLMVSLEKAIWNWMDTYPHEFAEIQVSYLRIFFKLSPNVLLPLLILYTFGLVLMEFSNIFRKSLMKNFLKAVTIYLTFWTLPLIAARKVEQLCGLFRCCFSFCLR